MTIDFAVKAIEGIAHNSGPSRIVRHIARHSDRPPRVIEVGTAYGDHLPFYAPLCELVVAIDPMYDWVPDLPPSERFDPSKVDERKVAAWNANTAAFSDHVKLVIGSSYEVHEGFVNDGRPFDVVIVDGCHSSDVGVADDYLNFRAHMAIDHFVVFDNMEVGACSRGVDIVLRRLVELGSPHTRYNIDFKTPWKCAVVWVRGHDERGVP